MLTVLAYVQSIKWIVPATFLFGSAPNFFIIWLAWRSVTAVLPRKVYVAGDDFLYSLYQRLVLFFYETYTGVKIVLYGDALELVGKKENVIFISNHQSSGETNSILAQTKQPVTPPPFLTTPLNVEAVLLYVPCAFTIVDWIIADMLGERQNSIGHIRYVLKEELKWIPLYGLYFKQHGCIYVNRAGRFEQKKAEKQLDRLKDTKTPFWIVIFPEGTRFNPVKKRTIEKSQTFAKERGMEPLEAHLTPRVKALALTLSRLRGATDAVYDVTLAYSDTQNAAGQRLSPPSLAEFLLTKSKEVHIHVSRIPVASIPTDDDALFTWIYRRFQVKDRMMRHFYGCEPGVRGTLGPGGQERPLPISHTLPSFLFFCGVGGFTAFTHVGRTLYWQASLASSLLCLLWAVTRPS